MKVTAYTVTANNDTIVLCECCAKKQELTAITAKRASGKPCEFCGRRSAAAEARAKAAAEKFADEYIAFIKRGK